MGHETDSVRVAKVPSRETGSSGVSATLNSLVAFAQDIKVAHSIFAMPFAGAAFVLGACQPFN